MQNMRVYVSGQNLITITAYNGLDPEFEGDVLSPGMDPMAYPNVRTFSAGLNLTF